MPATPTISKYAIGSILGHLDAAAVALPPSQGLESDATWNLRMARTRLYEAAIGDVEIQPSEVAFAREHGLFALAARLDADNDNADLDEAA